ncbi:hypothetical protein, partial [Pseudomonas aeruginosa]
NSAENVRRCLLIRHLSHGEDSRLNRCPGSVDHYKQIESSKASIQVPGRVQSRVNLMAGGKMRVERINGQMYFPYPDF